MRGLQTWCERESVKRHTRREEACLRVEVVSFGYVGLSEMY